MGQGRRGSAKPIGVSRALAWSLCVLLAAVLAIGSADRAAPMPRPSFAGDSIMFSIRQYRQIDPALYRLAYIYTSHCVGTPKDPTPITWWVANGIWLESAKSWAIGLYLSAGFRGQPNPAIIIDREHTLNLQVIVHESLHDITGLPDPLPADLRRRCEYGYEGG